MSKKIILITGTSRGIGAGMKALLEARGHTVYGSSRNPAPGSVRELSLEVADAEACRRAVEEVTEREGRLDVLVNNVGYHLIGAHEEASLAEIRDQFEVNFFGALAMMKAATPVMLKQRAGKIINLISTAGEIGLPFMAAYSASKFALTGYAESLRLELLPFGIYLSTVAPAGVKSGTTDKSVRAVAASHPLFAAARERVFAMTSRSEHLFPSSIEQVATVVAGIIDAPRPRPLYRVGALARLLMGLRAVMPQKSFERLLLKQVGAQK